MIQSWNLSYPVWKNSLSYLSGKGKGNVYYVQSQNTYLIILVSVDLGLLFQHSIARLGQSNTQDVLDFETNLKPNATSVSSIDDAVALAVAAASA